MPPRPALHAGLAQRLSLGVYRLLMALSAPLYLLRLWWRGRDEPLYRQHLGERFGRYRVAFVEPGALWLHAVSLGETRAAQPLIEALRQARPGLRLLLTHSTATGRDAGARLLRPGDRQAWLPYDTPAAVRRFLRHHQPCVGVLMETELWPVLMREAERAGVPVVQANARLSERSARRAAQWPSLMYPAAQRLALVLAQTVEDADRIRATGAGPVMVTGNLKFDIQPPTRQLARGLQWRQALSRSVVLAASTREGEEAELLQLWRATPAPRPLLLLVPRHPQRFDEVAELVRQAGFSLQRRSLWGMASGAGGAAPQPATPDAPRRRPRRSRPPPDAGQADVWLGDSLGEMPVYYACADVALLGGSFAPLGGQNLIEAAACGCPVVMGPHTFNFAQASVRSVQAGAAMRVDDLGEGVRQAVQLANAADRNAWVERALAFAAAHRGAAQMMVREIQRLVRR